MKATVLRVVSGQARLEEKDIEADPALQKRFLLHIPVLFLGGEELARHRVGEAELRAILSARGIL